MWSEGDKEKFETYLDSQTYEEIKPADKPVAASSEPEMTDAKARLIVERLKAGDVLPVIQKTIRSDDNRIYQDAQIKEVEAIWKAKVIEAVIKEAPVEEIIEK